MFKVGDTVKYRPGFCSDGEEKYVHAVLEIRLNPVTNEMSRYLIETLNSSLSLRPTEVVEECMIMPA